MNVPQAVRNVKCPVVLNDPIYLFYLEPRPPGLVTSVEGNFLETGILKSSRLVSNHILISVLEKVCMRHHDLHCFLLSSG
jgi:hypothetical protein